MSVENQNPELSNPVLPFMEEVWQQLNWQPNDIQQGQLQRLYELILAGNRQFNLTRITEPEEFWEKHLWDSLRGTALLAEGERMTAEAGNLHGSFVIDIGTGAGFPGIPVAIAHPHWSVTLLDSTRKKTAFLETLLDAIGIKNARALTGRAEDVGQQRKHRERYDLALVRAVASASVCAEYALPLLKIGGSAVLYRGQWTEAEAEALSLAAETLGGTVESVDSFATPLSQSVRHCVYLKKTAHTPSAFPRPTGIPAQKPL